MMVRPYDAMKILDETGTLDKAAVKMSNFGGTRQWDFADDTGEWFIMRWENGFNHTTIYKIFGRIGKKGRGGGMCYDSLTHRNRMTQARLPHWEYAMDNLEKLWQSSKHGVGY